MPVSKFFALVTSLGEGIDCFKSGSAPCGFCDLLRVGQNFFYMLLEIGLVLAVGVIVYGAIMLIVSHGNENLLKKGKEAITGAVVGMLLALGGWVIINTVFYILLPSSSDYRSTWSQISCEQPSPVIPIEILPTSTEATGGFIYAKVAFNGKYSCSTSSCNSVEGACVNADVNAYCFSLVDASNCGNDYPSPKTVWGYQSGNNWKCYATEQECTDTGNQCQEGKIDNFSGPAAGQCPVSPLSSSWSSYGLHWDDSSIPSNSPIKCNLTKLKGEFDQMVTLLGKLGINTDATSAYRPYEYQKHLFEIWSKCNDSHIDSQAGNAESDCNSSGSSDTAVRNNCVELFNTLSQERAEHFGDKLPGVVANPDEQGCTSHAPHMIGMGVDIILSYERQGHPDVQDYSSIDSNGNIATSTVPSRTYTCSGFNSQTIPASTLYLQNYPNRFDINQLLGDAGIHLHWQNAQNDKAHFNLKWPFSSNPSCNF